MEQEHGALQVAVELRILQVLHQQPAGLRRREIVSRLGPLGTKASWTDNALASLVAAGLVDRGGTRQLYTLTAEGLRYCHAARIGQAEPDRGDGDPPPTQLKLF